jgi:phage shock protein A
MVTQGSKGDVSQAGLVTDALEAVRTLQQNLQHTDACLQQVEDAKKIFGRTHQKMDEKIDGIYKTLEVNRAVLRNFTNLSPILLLHHCNISDV